MKNKSKASRAKPKSKQAKKGGSYGTLHELLILKLQSLYDIENEIVKALPKMAASARNAELRQGFKTHLEETRTQADRLLQAMEHLNVTPKKEKAAGIRGIAEDGSWVIKNVKDAKARDAALIAAAQYVEHYEIAGYTAALEWAELMGHDEVAALLQQNLSEEEATRDKLTALAEGGINDDANDMQEDESVVDTVMERTGLKNIL